MPAPIASIPAALLLLTLPAIAEPPQPAAAPSPAPADATRGEPAAIDPETMRLGRTTYITCAACHGQQGEGTGAGPPLAGSEWVSGPPENLIRIQLRGLEGPITVKGREYNIPGGMAPLAYQTDTQIAAVLTYVRNSFGNTAPPITPEQVNALRDEVGKPKLQASDLIPPQTPTPAPPETSSKYDDLPDPDSNKTTWIAAIMALAITIPLIWRLKKRS